MCAVCCDERQEMDVPDLIPARMLNEFCYCPRLAYLEWVQGEFADNLETREGRFGHRRVDKASRAEVPEPGGEVTAEGRGTRDGEGDGAEAGPHPNLLAEGEGYIGPHPGPLPKGEGDSGPRSLTPGPRSPAPDPRSLAPAADSIHSRSVMLSAPGEGLIARVDVLDLQSGVAVPVDYKRDKLPDETRLLAEPDHPLGKGEVRRLMPARDAAGLLGIEGMAAKEYFGGFARLLKEGSPLSIEGRNRRPPRDPVNALLSSVYAMLVKELTVVLHTVGFDPMLGFFHRPRYGRPSLALDLAEEFRPLVGDSVVLTLINNGEVTPGSFVRRAGAVALTDAGRRAVIAAFERRLDTLVTHPTFGYRISYRRVLEVQARLLGRTLLGEIPRYASFCTR
jgi:hypothetical protein